MDDKRTVSIATFIICAIGCTVFEISGELLDKALGFDFVFEPVALILTIIICLIAINLFGHHHVMNRGAAKKTLLLSAVPIGLSALILALFAKDEIEAGGIALIIISVFLSAVVEELYFRGIGIQLLHDDDGKICLKDTCWLCGVFGAMHFLPAILVPDLWLEELVYSLVAMALAYFLLGVYVAADSSVLPTLVHMMVLLPQRLSHSVDHNSSFVRYGVFAIYLIMTVFCVAAGAHLLHGAKGYRKGDSDI